MTIDIPQSYKGYPAGAVLLEDYNLQYSEVILCPKESGINFNFREGDAPASVHIG